jgi:hypothetical protein
VFDRGHHWRDRNDTTADAAAALHARWLHLTDTGIDVRLRDGDRSTLTEYHHGDRHSYLISLRRALGLREALATLELAEDLIRGWSCATCPPEVTVWPWSAWHQDGPDERSRTRNLYALATGAETHTVGDIALPA